MNHRLDIKIINGAARNDWLYSFHRPIEAIRRIHLINSVSRLAQNIAKTSPKWDPIHPPESLTPNSHHLHIIPCQHRSPKTTNKNICLNKAPTERHIKRRAEPTFPAGMVSMAINSGEMFVGELIVFFRSFFAIPPLLLVASSSANIRAVRHSSVLFVHKQISNEWLVLLFWKETQPRKRAHTHTSTHQRKERENWKINFLFLKSERAKAREMERNEKVICDLLPRHSRLSATASSSPSSRRSSSTIKRNIITMSFRDNWPDCRGRFRGRGKSHRMVVQESRKWIARNDFQWETVRKIVNETGDISPETKERHENRFVIRTFPSPPDVTIPTIVVAHQGKHRQGFQFCNFTNQAYSLPH